MPGLWDHMPYHPFGLDTAGSSTGVLCTITLNASLTNFTYQNVQDLVCLPFFYEMHVVHGFQTPGRIHASVVAQ